MLSFIVLLCLSFIYKYLYKYFISVFFMFSKRCKGMNLF